MAAPRALRAALDDDPRRRLFVPVYFNDYRDQQRSTGFDSELHCRTTEHLARKLGKFVGDPLAHCRNSGGDYYRCYFSNIVGTMTTPLKHPGRMILFCRCSRSRCEI